MNKLVLTIIITVFAAISIFAETVEETVAKAEKIIAETTAQTKLPRKIPNTFRQTLDQLQKNREFEKIDVLLDKARIIPSLSAQSERDLRFSRARALAANDRKGEAMTVINDLIASKNGVYESILAGADISVIGTQGFDAWYNFVEKYLDRTDASGLSHSEQISLISAYTAKADRGMNRKRLEKAEKYYETVGMPRKIGRLEQYREMDTFPLPEAELNIPSGLRDFGIDPERKVVHAKDFGWNAKDATECLTRALNSDASTVIIDDMGSPWYVYKVLLDAKTASNKQVVFKKGVKIHSVPLCPIKDPKIPFSYRGSDMFSLGDQKNVVSNMVFIGEGNIGDVYIGQFPDRKSRFATGLRYGGCAFAGWGTNILLKNLKLSNNLMDGFCMGGSRHYIVDCLLDDNHRQGMSVTHSHHCVYKNVTFCRTVGAEPHNGVDFEPAYEAYDTHCQYFFDCTFFDNAAGNVVFSTSTYAPVTVLFKRCVFEAGRNRNISIYPRLSKYLAANIRAPSNIIFDECRMDGYLDSPVLQINGFIFDVLFKNCVMNDKGIRDKSRIPNRSPIFLSLDRGYWEGYYQNAGTMAFENVQVNGWTNMPLVQVSDTNGKLGVNSFRGKIVHNGKEIDMSRFSYLPPDRTWKETSDPDLKSLVVPVTSNLEPGTSNWIPGFKFVYGHPWYQQRPQYNLLVRGTKGTKAEFTVVYNGNLKENGGILTSTAPSGAKKVVDGLSLGTNVVTVVFEEDGLYSVCPDGAIVGEGDISFDFVSIKGAVPSFATDIPSWGGTGRAVKLDTSLGDRKFIGYFEVKGGKPFNFKLMKGGVELRDETGKLVVRKTKDDYFGTTCFSTMVKNDAIWSFTALNDAIEFKFFDPQTGIWCEEPEALVTTKPGLPFRKIEGEQRFVAVDTGAGLPEKYEAEVAEMAARRLEIAKAGAAAAKKDYDDTSAQLDDMKKHADNDGIRREIEDITRTVERLKAKSDAYARALAETEEERKMAVVCGKWGMELAPEWVGGVQASMVDDDFFAYPNAKTLRQLYAVVVARMQ